MLAQPSRNGQVCMSVGGMEKATLAPVRFQTPSLFIAMTWKR